ncbi:MAG: 23S rRNA (adenine(2503)-C(2))-methyltransferase RlmN [Planctomycetota bacterium]|nr:23S rRNA (adenine(2503)-C(2))-methyltransferase RlmN [Planctomycetota bacterium]
MKDTFFDFTPETLEPWCTARGMPRFVGSQLIRWVYERGVTDPLQMTDIAKRNQECIASEMEFEQSVMMVSQLATDGTRKILLGWPKESSNTLPLLEPPTRRTECVMIPSEDRRTACVSSQVGCPVGCRFCASGIGGLEGNLTAGRIIEQVHRLRLEPSVGRISHVVFMGMGEPLANLGAVRDAIRTLNAPWGFGISARRITVSTVGLPAAIRQFCEFELPVTLALSLHAPNDELRRQIIPWAQYSTIDELLDACDEWFQRTGRELTFEYILLGGFNDRPQHAEELAVLARRMRANVNLIRYNEVEGLPFGRPSSDDVHRFQEVLRERGVNSHIRASRGRDIAAACGQLRHRSLSGVTGLNVVPTIDPSPSA